MSIYLLNSPILTDWGTYKFREINIQEAKFYLMHGLENYVSAIGHEGTAEILSKLLGFKVPANCISVKMETGDKAVVFKMLERLSEGKILTSEELEKLKYTFGILEKVD